MRIKLHSTTDLITNSSTTIYTYSNRSEQVLKQMIDEIFKTFNINKKCEDVFDTVVIMSSWEYQYAFDEDYGGDPDLVPEELKDVAQDDLPEAIKDICNKVEAGEMPKPKWMDEVEKKRTENCEYYPPSTYLHLIPKKPKYKPLAKVVQNFLYSTNHEACRDS